METLQEFTIKGMNSIIKRMGNPTFSWNGNIYSCIASVSQFKRDLTNDGGGFVLDQLLTMTVPRYDLEGIPTFPNDTIPESQQTLTFQSILYHIEAIIISPILNETFEDIPSVFNNGDSIKIIAVSANRGI